MDGTKVAEVTGTPTDWNDKAAMAVLGYAAAWEAVAERFHCTRGLLERLNPGVATPPGPTPATPGGTAVPPSI